MNTCGYCGTSLGEGAGKAYCGFCKMDVDPMKDGQRVPIQEPVALANNIYSMTTPQIMNLHTTTLLSSLKFLRDESRSTYSTMRIMKEAAKDNPKELAEVVKESGQQYEDIKRKIFVVENVVRERLGYIPQRITDLSIERNFNLSLNPNNNKPMIIRQPEQQKEEQKIGEGLSR